MSDNLNQMDYAEIRRRVEINLNRRRRVSRFGFLFANVTMFVTFVAMSVYFVSTTPGLSNLPSKMGEAVATALFLLIVGWGMGIFFHLLSVLMDMGLMDSSMRGRIVANEIAKEVMRLGLDSDTEKPKRQLMDDAEPEIRLSDDGELVPVEHSQTARRMSNRT